MKPESKLLIAIPVKCLGCSRIRTKQLSENDAIAFCRDEKLFKAESMICHRNTEFTD